MPRPSRLSLTLGILAAALWTLPLAAASSVPCETASASRLPAYATGGSWSPDGSRLFLVDPIYEEVHSYSAKDGRYLGPMPAPAAIGKSAFFPVSARSSGGQLVVESFPQRLLFLGDRFQVTSIHEPLREMKEAAADRGGIRMKARALPPATLESMFLLAFAGNDIVAWGDVQQADGNWETGMVRFPVDNPSSFQVQTVSGCARTLSREIDSASGENGLTRLSSEGSLDASGWCSGAPRGCGLSPRAGATTPTTTKASDTRATGRSERRKPSVASTQEAGEPPMLSNPWEPARASQLPAYATQGSWSPDGSTRLVVDHAYEQVYAYAARGGRYLGPMFAPAAIGKSAFFPVSARSSGGQLVVESFPQRLLFLGDRFQVASIHEPLGEMKEAATGRGGFRMKAQAVPPATLESIFMWAFAGNDIVACGDVKQADGNWETGIVRFPVDNPSSFQVQTASSFSSPEWVFCRLGFPYIASIGDRAFVLLFDEHPGIYESTSGDGGWKRLDYDLDVPSPVRLPEFSSEREFVATMAEVERTTMPVGLYSWDDSLFVLYRHFDARSGKTRWTLEELDPNTGHRRGSPATIHAKAAHLMLIPGKRWALVEKGPALEFGNQKTRDIRMLDSAAIPRPLQGEICAPR